jgi:excisionase family DNA binding protein
MSAALIAAHTGDPAWLSVRQAARALGVVSRTVYGLINAGRLPGYRIGRVIRVRHDDLDRFLESVRIEPGSLDHLCGPTSTEPPER